MNSSREEELELEIETPSSPKHKVRPKYLEFQQAYEQSLTSTREGHGVNATPSIQCSPMVMESDDKILEDKATISIDGREKESADDGQLEMQAASASDIQSNKVIDSISQSFRSESKGVTSQSCANNEPSPDCNASSENGVSIAQNFEVIRTSTLPAVEHQSSLSNPIGAPQQSIRTPARSSIQIQGSIIVQSMVQAAQEVIFEVGAAIDNEPTSALEHAEQQQQQAQNEDQQELTLVVDNLPWLVKTHFDFQDMISDVAATEFWFQKLVYPIMTFGLAVCSVIFSIMVNAIDVEKHGGTFLDGLAIKNASFQPKQAFILVYTNIYLYYAQTVTDVLMVCIMFITCRFRSAPIARTVHQMRRGSVMLLTAISFLLNLYNIFQLVVLWLFLSDEQIVELTKHDENGLGFLQWYQLCQILFDARRFFWFMLAFVMLFLGLSGLLVKSVLVIFYAYERHQGRIYQNTPQLRFHRRNAIKSHALRPEVKKFLDDNKQVYVIPASEADDSPDGSPAEKATGVVEECMICLQEFTENDPASLIVVLNCGSTPETALVPTPATVGTEAECYDTERGLATMRADSEQADSPCKAEKSGVIQKSRHIFHHDCLKEWLKKREVCPLCNLDVIPRPTV